MRRPRIETFDLNLFRLFDALLQHGSVNAAATEIGVTPSAISHALGRLRKIFEDELFVKGPGGMTPTARAAEIAPQIAAVLLQARSVLEPTHFEPGVTEWHFKVRCNHFISLLVLPQVMNLLQDKGPQIHLTVQSNESRSIADELDTGMVDLVVGAFHQVPTRFESEVLLSDRWVWILRADHPALSAGVDSKTILQLPQLVIVSDEVGRSIDGVVTDAGLERFVVADKVFLGDIKTKSRYSAQIKGTLVINSAIETPAIVAKSDLAALVPARLANAMSRHYKLKIIEADKEHNEFEHRMVWHRKHAADPAITWLRSVFRSSVSGWDDNAV